MSDPALSPPPLDAESPSGDGVEPLRSFPLDPVTKANRAASTPSLDVEARAHLPRVAAFLAASTVPRSAFDVADHLALFVRWSAGVCFASVCVALDLLIEEGKARRLGGPGSSTRYELTRSTGVL